MMDKRDLNTIELSKNSSLIEILISDIRESERLQRSIQSTEDKIRGLKNRVENKIDKAVYACSDVDELINLCKSCGLDKEGYRGGMAVAHENSFGGDTDYEKTEWSDILFHTALDLKVFVEKKAKDKSKE